MIMPYNDVDEIRRFAPRCPNQYISTVGVANVQNLYMKVTTNEKVKGPNRILAID